MLTKEQFKAAIAVKPIEVTIAGVGSVFLRPLSGDARDWLDGRMQDARRNIGQYVGIRREVVGRSLCDQNGNPLYQPAEYAELGNADGSVIDAIFQECQRVSGLIPSDDSERQSSVDASAKNS